MTDQQAAPSPGLTSRIETKSRTLLLIRSVLAAGCSSFLLAVAAVAGPVAPAQAAGSCSLLAPARVGIYSWHQVIPLKVSSGCPARLAGGFAAWNAYHPTRGRQVSATFDGTTQQYWDMVDYETPLGVWTWRAGGCWDGYSHPCAQNSPRTDIRVGSQAALTATRAGSYRTLSVATAYFRVAAASRYVMWAHEKVHLQYRSCPACSWTYLRNVYTASNGRATFRTYSAHLRYYRAVSANAPTIWGRTSAVILR